VRRLTLAETTSTRIVSEDEGRERGRERLVHGPSARPQSWRSGLNRGGKAESGKRTGFEFGGSGLPLHLRERTARRSTPEPSPVLAGREDLRVNLVILVGRDQVQRPHFLEFFEAFRQ